MLEIAVYKNSAEYAKRSRCFVERVNLVGLDIPYTSVTDGMRFIFGQSCIIEFILL